MSEPESAIGRDAAALVTELFKAAMEIPPRSVFEQRALIERALLTIRRMRAGQEFGPVFDADHSALHKVVQVHHAIGSAPDHHIRAAMLIAAELLDMLQPSPVSPLGQALRKRSGDQK